MQPTKRRILCAEDDDDTCFMLTTLLGQSNYEAVSANTMNDALRLARRERFDLYILDKRFPDGTGVELCVRLHTRDPNIPIVFYSGDAYESDRREGLAAGAQEYVTKPDVEELIETVNRLLHKSNGEVI